MKILAGLGLDARRPNDTGPLLGTVAVGAAGLLEALEIRAGLVLPRQPQAERVVRYRNALTAADTPARFYHRSLGSDPLASAQTLLSWRDFALDHGWMGTPGAGSPGRLADLAEVEAQVAGLSPCAAERVAALLPRLGWVAAAVEEIALLDPRSDWPVPHQRLFDALEGAGIPLLDCASPLVPGATDGTDLGSLQRCLAAEPAPTEPLSLAGDGTLTLLHCLDSQAGANALCLRLASQPNHLLIAGSDAFLLGAAARHRGFADPGLGERSYWRPPLQLLPLVIQIAWSPPAADALLQYLTLPAGPYRSLRRAIAKQFTDLPGHDTDVWQVEVDAFVQRCLEKDPAADEAGLRQGIHAWLPVGEAGGRERMTRDLAMRLVDQVAEYWRSRYGSLAQGELVSAESRQFLAAYQAADALGVALRAWDGAEISREQLDRLLEIAAETNASVFAHARQVSGLNCVNTPEAARLGARAPEHLAWWEPALGAEGIPPPFDAAERAALPGLPDLATEERRRQASLMRALRPIMSATGSLTLVVRDESADLLRLHLDLHIPRQAWRSLDAELIDGGMRGLGLSPMSDLSLPPRQRWWEIGRSVPCPRPRESYSSLASLALSPHAYVLGYAARLSEGAIAAVPVDSRLKGNLGHRLVEAWFDEHPWMGLAATEAEISAWLDDRLDAVISAKALPLSAPGMRAERLAFQVGFSHALLQLLRHLAGAGVTDVRIEQRLECALPNMDLEGAIDLVGHLSDGRWVIVDIKWGGEKDRIADLKEGRYLQLATYARLVEGLPSARVSEVAYFILRSGDLLATSRRVFPDARVVEPNDALVTPAMVWDRFQATVHWRSDQLGAGRVEVPYADLTTAADSQPPPGCLPLLDMEQGAAKQSGGQGGRRPGFKIIDPWRVLVGQIKE